MEETFIVDAREKVRNEGLQILYRHRLNSFDILFI